MKNTDKYETNIGRNSIIDLFEMQVQLTPDFTALVCGDWWLKYSELNGMVNRLARELITHNVGSEMVVGIMVSRSLEMIISILAVLKAGAAYLPIDPQYPEERISYMLEDSKVQLLLTQSDYYDKVNYDCMKIDVSDERVYNHEETNLCNNISPNSLAYVIYTSGSTGLPKGVMIEHQAVCNFIRGICEIIDFSEGKKILNITTISFDIFLLETILPLTRGVTVVIANEREQKDPEALAKVILKNKIHILQLTPSRLKLLADSKVFASIFESISEILIGGEPFPEVMLPELSKYDKLKIFNMYGPTETTVWSTVKDMTGKNKVSIGKPILNTDIYILDENNNPVSNNDIGELCIGGMGLARGYMNREELTSEKFVSGSTHISSRFYKTGDLARINEDGEIECLGRKDNQVKIRGYRIEIEEIENCILLSQLVRSAAVIVKTDSQGMMVLSAYVVYNDKVCHDELKSFMQKRLPEYMIPAEFVAIEEMPLTQNGKINRNVLSGRNN